MPHRDELEALRAKVELLEEDNAGLTAQLAEVTKLLEETTAALEALEPNRTDVARLGQRASQAERARRAAEERAAALQARLDRIAQQDETGSDTSAAFAARTPETRLASAEQFAREGRGREALQIVLSTERTAPTPRGRELLSRRVRCDRCAQHVRMPSRGTEALARFLRGRCPTCGQLLGLTDG